MQLVDLDRDGNTANASELVGASYRPGRIQLSRGWVEVVVRIFGHFSGFDRPPFRDLRVSNTREINKQ